jgi:hypothetical protein
LFEQLHPGSHTRLERAFVRVTEVGLADMTGVVFWQLCQVQAEITWLAVGVSFLNRLSYQIDT